MLGRLILKSRLALDPMLPWTYVETDYEIKKSKAIIL